MHLVTVGYEGTSVQLRAVIHIPSSSIIPNNSYYTGSMQTFLNKLDYNTFYYVTGFIDFGSGRYELMGFAKANKFYQFPACGANLSSGFCGFLYGDSEDYQLEEYNISTGLGLFDYVYSQTYIELI